MLAEAKRLLSHDIRASMLCLGFSALLSLHLGAQDRDSLILLLDDPETSLKEKISLSLEIGKTYRWREGAEHYFHLMRDYSTQADDPEHLAKANEYLGTYHFYHSKLDSSLPYYLDALEGYRLMGVQARQAEMHNNAGLVLHRKGDYVEALRHYQAALDIFKALSDSAGIAKTINKVGGIYRDQKKYDLALPYYAQSLAIAESIGNVQSIVDATGNQGIIYQLLDSLNKSIAAYERTLALSRKHNLIRRVRTCVTNLGALYLKQGSLDEAEAHLLEARSLIKNQGAFISVETNLGKVQLRKGDAEQAAELCHRAYEMALESGGKEQQMRALECAIAAYRTLGDFQQALELFTRYDQLKDSIYTESNIREITELEMQYKFDQEQERLLADQQRKDTRQSWLRNILLLGLISLALIAYLIYRSALERKMTNQLLQEKNATIQKALDERELLLREIHHRVKNNLQVVTSLLSLQSSYIHDQRALEAINEGRDRVQSMALIHQNLYRRENLTGIRVNAYFKKLVEGLFESYNIHKDRIQLEMELEDLNLDVDTVIPLGLIVNELVSNALKYAFPKGHNGRIHLSLYEKDDKLYLEVADNGVGVGDKWREENDSFGFQLIHAFADKLDADLDVDGSEGTRVKLSIRDYRKAG